MVGVRSIESDEVAIYVFILFIGTHKEYERLLGY
jgi:hypothetical protein